MTFDPYADRFPFAADLLLHNQSSTPSVKSEPSSSPHSESPIHTFSFSYPVHSHAAPDRPLIPYHPSNTERPPFRFGMAHPSPDAWSLKRHHDPAHAQNIALDLNTIPFHDDYDDPDDLGDLPASGPPPSGQSDRIVRRRSSKACDQCRKSKCKCERAAEGGACKSCIMLGTPCTFLGPSRKRGPPKGYIDAIEARLHQTEALLGILLAVEAERAEDFGSADSHGNPRKEIPEKADNLEGILTILRKDTLAREILNRVDASPYGVKGRKAGGVKPRPHVHAQENSGSAIDLHSTHPSNEWQDRVASMLASSLQSHANSRPTRSPTSAIVPNVVSLNDPHSPQSRHPSTHITGDNTRRQRRRVDDDEGNSRNSSPKGSSLPRTGSISPGYSPHPNSEYASGYLGASTDSDSDEDVADAVGQLSLNEDEQVRYHGKASGLYLLGINAKAGARNEGGIWRFPKARVWPPLPSSTTDIAVSPSSAFCACSVTPSTKVLECATARHLTPRPVLLDGDLASLMPDLAMQDHLLELYFTYVHTAFPILHKDAFWEGYQSMRNPPADTPSPASDLVQVGPGNSPGPSQGKRRHVSYLLLFSMFAIAARYSSLSSPLDPRGPASTSQHSSEPGPMWTAGDNYLQVAKSLLDNTYASSLPSTVQSLLLLGYREIGIGAMAQSWFYTGMAVRMAQDLGMHRAADGWARASMGKLFCPRQLQERRRIWWGCVVLDGYVSTYIGRPLAIFEKDYDTQFPGTEECEEREVWTPHPSLPPDTKGHGYHPRSEVSFTDPGHVLSCFNASAELSTILSKIVQSIYSIRTGTPRHIESIHIEGLLDKWYFDLPEHLRFELRYDSMGNLNTIDSRRTPPPHVLTLHMQYWCTTLLLHRPFIRQMYLSNKNKPENGNDEEVRVASEKNYELCAGAANHIASIVSYYRENHCLQRAPVFLSFYVFTASIMHVTTLSLRPNDPQARIGLTRCMDALQDMEAVWPSAARAHELLRGCDPLNKKVPKPANFGHAIVRNNRERQKRTAEHSVDSEDAYERSQMHAHSSVGGPLTSSQPYPQTWRSTQFQAPQSGDFPPTTPTSLTSTQQPSSYYSWPSDGGSYVPFPGTLSTSVLPQMYSTGLLDERRLPHTMTSSQHGHPRLSGHSTTSGPSGFESASGGRYPQFWNDYTSFPQMGMTYGQSPGGNAHGQEGVYLGEQYESIYDHSAPSPL